MDVKVIDGALNYGYIVPVYEFVLGLPYSMNSSSSNPYFKRNNKPVSQLTKEQINSLDLSLFIEQEIKAREKGLVLERCYANVYESHTPTIIHADHFQQEAVTIIYMATPYWDMNWGGELIFYESNEAKDAVSFVPGRIVIFPAYIQHKVAAVSPIAEMPRLTIAYKYYKREV